MPYEHDAIRYRRLYAYLLHLYPKPYRMRFGEGMEQTFNDLCRERTTAGKGLFTFALWAFGDTFIGIVSTRIAFIFSFFVMNATHILRPALGTALLLMIPFIAMRFTDHVQWDSFDFIFMGILLFGCGLTYEFLSKKSGSGAYKFAVGLAVLAAFLLVWVNAAVGIIGNENNAVNMLYFGVHIVAIIGAIVTRMQPRGMSHAMFVTAGVQILIPAIGLLIFRPELDTADQITGVVQAFGASAFLALPWIGSAMLFRNAAGGRK